MTGKELIVYILENNLENEEVFKDGKLLGFMTEAEAAIKFNVGVSTIRVWAGMEYIKSFKIGNTVYIPCNAEDPRLKNEKGVGYSCTINCL